MATDLEKLVVSFDADIRQLTNKLNKAGVAVETFGRKADRDSAAAAKKVSDNLSKATAGGHGGGQGGGGGDTPGALSYVQKQEFVHIGKSIADEVAAGQSPLRAIQVEGGRIVQAFSSGPGGVGGTFKALGSTLTGLVSPAALAAAGVLGIGAAALYAYSSFEEAERGIKLGLLGIGAASGATVSDIRRIGAELAAAQGISTGAGEDIALSLAKTGKIDVGSIGDVGKLTRGYANLTGQDLGEAGKGLGDIFSDPAKGAETLNRLLGTLDSKTRSYITTLQAQGDIQGALKALLAAASPEILKAADATSYWGGVWQRLKNEISQTGEVINRVVHGAAPDEQIARLTTSLAQLNRAKAANLPEAPVAKTARDALIADTEKRLADLQGRVLKERRDKDDTVVDRRQVEASGQIDDKLKGVDADAERIKDFGDRIAAVRKALAVPGAAERSGLGADKAKQDLAALEAQYAEIKRVTALGGQAPADALQQAEFGRKRADLDSFAAGLADINHEFDELERNARAAGNLAAIPTYEKTRADRIAAYKANSAQKVEDQGALPADFVRVVIGAEGNNAAKNPRSSASGFGQFTNSTFLDQYRKVFPESAATLDDKGILALKSDLAVNQKLVENYGKEIRQALIKAGITPSLQNLYLGYHFGVGGASKLLKADPNASAASILGADVANANPEEVKGRTAGQLIGAIDARVLRNTSGGRTQTAAIASEQARAASYGQTAAETAKLSSLEEQLNADRERGGELGQRFASAADLIHASSATLTPALAAERAEMLRLADARSAAADAAKQAAATAEAAKQIRQERADLGLTSGEASIQNRVRGFGLDPSAGQGADLAGQLRQIQAAGEVKNEAVSSIEELTHALIEGRSAGEALHSVLQRLGEKIADKALDSLVSSAFSTGSSGGGGGLFSAIGSLLGIGHATGTIVRGAGGPTADKVPAMLSAGEAVLPAVAVRQNPRLVAALIGGRYAQGGIIGTPNLPDAVRPISGGASSYVHAPTYNLPASAPGVTPEQMVQAIGTYDRQSRRSMVSTLARSRQRYA